MMNLKKTEEHYFVSSGKMEPFYSHRTSGLNNIDAFPSDETLTDAVNFTDATLKFPYTIQTSNNESGLNELCGVPGICKFTAQQNCFNKTLANCPDCSSVASGLFLFIASCLGLAILFGNLLILFVFARLNKKRKATHIDWYKASLAVADLLTGLQIFFVIFPNFAWSRNSTFQQLQEYRLTSQFTVSAIAGGFSYLLVFTSSLYHLVLLGIMRLYAIQWPFKHRQLTMRSVYISIGVVWILAAIMSSIPAWFPQYFHFDYYHVTFLYLPSMILITLPSFSFTPGIVALVVLLIIPYGLMKFLLLSTAISVRIHVTSSKATFCKNTSNSNQDNSTFSKKEIAVFKTVALMKLGYTITIAPLCVAVSLIYSGYLTCDMFSTSFLICVYLSMTNSLVNVLIYSVREKKFRETAREIFRNFKPAIFDDSILLNSRSSTAVHSKDFISSSERV